MATLARLERLRKSLETAVSVTTELEMTRLVVHLAAQAPERWNPTLDSLAAAMEPDKVGSVQHLLDTLAAALGPDC